MWFRDEQPPRKYNGISFRSGLEATAAKALDDLGVTWDYERQVDDVDWYLPDFTILSAAPEYELPRWVEVKPAELLYAVRDHLGAPERFDDDITASITAKQLFDESLEEIWKPKLLAEFTHGAVLVVSKINRNRTLSIEMQPEAVILSRHQPCVNWRQVQIDRERQERERRWQAEARERQRQRVAAEAQQRNANLAWARSATSRPARYAGWCIVCSEERQAHQLRIARHEDRWLAFCAVHVA